MDAAGQGKCGFGTGVREIQGKSAAANGMYLMKSSGGEFVVSQTSCGLPAGWSRMHGMPGELGMEEFPGSGASSLVSVMMKYFANTFYNTCLLRAAVQNLHKLQSIEAVILERSTETLFEREMRPCVA